MKKLICKIVYKQFTTGDGRRPKAIGYLRYSVDIEMENKQNTIFHELYIAYKFVFNSFGFYFSTKAFIDILIFFFKNRIGTLNFTHLYDKLLKIMNPGIFLYSFV